MGKHVFLFLSFVLLLNASTLSQNIDSLKQVVKEVNDQEAVGSAYKQLLRNAMRKDSIDFVQTYKEAILWSTEQNAKELQFEFEFKKCQWLYRTRNYDAVNALVDSVLPELRPLKLFNLEADFLNYTGSAYANQGSYPEALVEHIEQLSVASRIESSTRPKAMAANNVGMVLLNLERYDQAIPYLQQSIAYQEGIERSFKAHTYWNLGICFMEKKEYDKALGIFQSGVTEAKEKNDKYALAGNLLCIASIYIRKDDLENGIKAYEEVYALTKEANMQPFKHIEALNGLIYSYNHSKQPENALQYIEIADSIIEANDLQDVRNLDYLIEKSRTLYQMGRPAEGEAILERYVNAKDSLYSEKNLELIQEKETEYRTKEKEQMLQLRESELSFQRIVTAVSILGAVLLAFIGFLVYRQQRLKLAQERQEQALKEALLEVETNKKLEAQRLQIAKELHDNIGSQLTYLASSAQNIGAMVDTMSTEKTQQKLEQLAVFSQEAISDLRDTLWVMNRSSISVEDLAERARYLAYKVANSTGIQVTVHKEGEKNKILDPNQAMGIYRIIQESVANAVKHANASNISINFDYDPLLEIKITDDGDGFDESSVTSSSNGLNSMKVRAAKLDATFSIDSQLKKGTTIHLKTTVD